MKKKDDTQKFWNVVVDCLVKFHNWKTEQSKTEVHKYQEQLKSNILIYHEEPFSIACEIADKKLDIATYTSRYEQILKRRKW